MNMFSRLSYSVLRNEERAISVAFRGFGLAQRLCCGCDTGVVRAAGEHAGGELGGCGGGGGVGVVG